MQNKTVVQKLLDIGAQESLISEAKQLEQHLCQKLISQIDESPYSLSEWCETLNEFEKWCAHNNKPLQLTDKLEYLYCCVQGASAQGRLLSLKSAWENYINQYGVTK